MDCAGETQEERQGKMLLHTEYSLLSLLHNQDGVVHHHGLFQVEQGLLIITCFRVWLEHDVYELPEKQGLLTSVKAALSQH